MMERFEVRSSLRPPILSQNRALTEHPWTWCGEQDVKLPDPSDENEGVDVLEITSGPGTFVRLVEDDGRVRGVQMVESSGASFSPHLSTPQRATLTRLMLEGVNRVSSVPRLRRLFLR